MAAGRPSVTGRGPDPSRPLREGAVGRGTERRLRIDAAVCARTASGYAGSVQDVAYRAVSAGRQLTNLPERTAKGVLLEHERLELVAGIPARLSAAHELGERAQLRAGRVGHLLSMRAWGEQRQPPSPAAGSYGTARLCAEHPYLRVVVPPISRRRLAAAVG